MKPRKKQGFVHGALILMLSNIVVKAIGALFKIPLSNIIGDTAMGYFNSAYSIYSMCFLISTAGLPVAISRMIAASRARGKRREVEKIYRVSLMIFLGIGIIGTMFLFFGADAIARLPGEPELAICIKAISPIMFFICLVSCVRGYFQGNQNMTPTAVSQIVEVLGNLFLGLSAGIFAKKAGYASPVIAAFALAGITLGVVASGVYLAFVKWLSDRQNAMDQGEACESAGQIARSLIAIAIPITISSSVLSLTSVIDSMLAVRRLNDACVNVIYFAAQSTKPVAVTLYGAYMAKAITLFNLPPTIIYPFAISIIPTISASEATGDQLSLKKTMDFTFRIVSVICLPAAIGMGVLARPIIGLLFSSNEPVYFDAAGTAHLSNDITAPMLAILCGAIVFSGLISVSGAMLQASGFERKSIISTTVGVSIKALAVVFLIGIPRIGYFGIPLSTLFCYLVMFLFNMYFLSRYVGYRLPFRKVLLRPLIAALVCGVSALISYALLQHLISFKLATVASIVIAALVYIPTLFLIRGFETEDVLMLPKGETVLRLLQKVRLLPR